MKMVQMKMKMKMNNLNKIYEGILGEQAAPAGSEDNRKAALGALGAHVKELNLTKQKAQEYKAAVDGFFRAVDRLEGLSTNPLLIKYALKLQDNMDNISEPEEEMLMTFQSMHEEQIQDVIRGTNLSPLN